MSHSTYVLLPGTVIRGSFRTKPKHKVMNRITAIIERGNDGGFTIYAENVKGLIGTGMTEDEARKDFVAVREEQAEFYAEKHGTMPEWADEEIDFRYSLAAFFVAFPYINATQFAKCIGLNPSLMRKYKMGLASASGKQKQIIQENLNILTDKLQCVQFV